MLSTPLDLLRFNALSFVDRNRLGLLVFQVRRIRDWKAIEHLSIREWLEGLCGKTVYAVEWAPLITSKFSVHAEAVNAGWMWKILVLRGSTRYEMGEEELAYFKGGFGRLAEAIVAAIQRAGGEETFGTPVAGVVAKGRRVSAIRTSGGGGGGGRGRGAPAGAGGAGGGGGSAEPAWLAKLRRVQY